MPPLVEGTVKTKQTAASVSYAHISAAAGIPASHQFTVTDASGSTITINVNTALQSVQIH